MSTNKKVYLAICGISIVLLSIALFLLWPDRSKVFWVTYVFSVIAILGVGINAVYLKEENQHFAANITLHTISIVYLIVSALWSIVSIAILNVGSTIYMVTHIVILGLFLILWLLAILAVQHINDQDR